MFIWKCLSLLVHHLAVYLSKQTDESMELTEVWPLTFTILSLTLQASPPTCLTVGRLQLSGGGRERECEEVFQREEG